MFSTISRLHYSYNYLVHNFCKQTVCPNRKCLIISIHFFALRFTFALSLCNWTDGNIELSFICIDMILESIFYNQFFKREHIHCNKYRLHNRTLWYHMSLVTHSSPSVTTFWFCSFRYFQLITYRSHLQSFRYSQTLKQPTIKRIDT